MKRNILLAGLLFNLALIGCSRAPTSESSAATSTPLFPVKQNGKWGYINASGSIVIPPHYAAASRFSDGLARVDNTFIDTTGKVVIDLKPLMDQQIGPAGDFSDGMVVIKRIPTSSGLVSNLAMGLYNTNINVGASRWSTYGYMDKNGQIVIPPQFPDAQPFSEGLAIVMVPEGHVGKTEYLIIDHAGKVVMKPPAINGVGSAVALPKFHEGLCAVLVPAGADPRYGFPQYAWEFIDQSGKAIIPAQFQGAKNFSEGLAAVAVPYSPPVFKWGFIDKTGQMVIPATYEDVDDFSDGLAPVKIDNRWGFIDRNGTSVIQPMYEIQPSKFEAGIAMVTIDNKVGYIDHLEHYVWRPSD